MEGLGLGLPEEEAPVSINCTNPAIDDFPRDLFTDKQRQDGAVVLHALIALYLFAALAVVCDKYFVPAVERICHALNMSNDVAGATFMAAATSAPELFVNVIGTFITEGDIGVGTIVGSAVFNILAVAACCGIGAGMVVPLDWWPLTRDCLAYGVTVAFLICIIHDERVEWYEALTLVLLYIVYIAVMYWDKSIQNCARGGVGSTASRRQSESSPTEAGEVLLSVTASPPPAEVAEEEKQSLNPTIQTAVAASGTGTTGTAGTGTAGLGASEQVNGSIKATEEARPAPEEGECIQLFSCPDGGWWRRVVWVVTWPIHLVFLFTIPDCEKPKFKRLFPLTFFMCIVWIGSLSYVVAWLITIIGDTLKIPDSVMGITFLAAGTSVPEAVSSVIVAKQGHGSMGISNSIGSNTFDILLCLGLPWFIKASFLPTAKGHHYVNINSRGLEYSAISLLSTLLLLYVTFYANKFKLDRKMGQACLLMYAVFLILATLIELNVFFVVNLPTCGR
ncbi:Sodium/potassium/calcium exchanger 3 [Frankliniella fusca]|uniref:Sodium/potassium/calcium exchanger 5 n=1 Tax=Frankliniella fusca TaxID=407009 RepID=A0AAE1HKB7_9NEOP|nr:Sodium/potassium/calcium exchanger 3 [Frankliniella fusca]